MKTETFEFYSIDRCTDPSCPLYRANYVDGYSKADSNSSSTYATHGILNASSISMRSVMSNESNESNKTMNTSLWIDKDYHPMIIDCRTGRCLSESNDGTPQNSMNHVRVQRVWILKSARTIANRMITPPSNLLKNIHMASDSCLLEPTESPVRVTRIKSEAKPRANSGWHHPIHNRVWSVPISKDSGDNYRSLTRSVQVTRVRSSITKKTKSNLNSAHTQSLYHVRSMKIPTQKKDIDLPSLPRLVQVKHVRIPMTSNKLSGSRETIDIDIEKQVLGTTLIS